MKEELELFVKEYYADKGYVAEFPLTYDSLLVDGIWHITTKIYTSQIDSYLSRLVLASNYPDLTEKEAFEKHKLLMIRDLDERRLEEQIALTVTRLQGDFILHE